MLPHSPEILEQRLQTALKARKDWLSDVVQSGTYDRAFRLFNGFLEGYPDLVIDLYGYTLLIFNYAENPHDLQPSIEQVLPLLLQHLPWVQSVLLKTRHAGSDEERRGRLILGSTTARKIREHGVWYAVDLQMNMDASLYLDTRSLRAWAIESLTGKRVLNTFAYTGSLGVAALAGGASQVIQLDLNRRFLNLAKDSYALNGFPVQRADFRAGDFWVQVNQLKRAGELFDCIFIDPPFFSTTGRGTVDLVSQSFRVINKVRPLAAHNGILVAINNALFLSGADYMRMLEDLCKDGYLSIEALIPVTADFTGFPASRVGDPPVDPAPFNHSTKIALLRARRKDERPAGSPPT